MQRKHPLVKDVEVNSERLNTSRVKFLLHKLKIEKNDNDVATQIGAEVLEIGVNTEDVVKEKVMVDAEIQEKVHTLDKETTTEEFTLGKLEDVLKIDRNGNISPGKGEVLVELSISHELKTWEDILEVIKAGLKMNVCGKPWLANSGRLFKTVGFRTQETDFERWRAVTFNWQDSGVRKVSSSRLYR